MMNGKRAYFAASRGFSLVEVNLAILLVSFGLLALFALFPAGLREADSSIADTHAALFGDYVLSGMQANASDISAYATWASDVDFPGAVLNGLSDDDDNALTMQDSPAKNISPAIKFSRNKLRYILQKARSADKKTVTICLWVSSGEYGTGVASNFCMSASFFCTELYYMGAIQ